LLLDMLGLIERIHADMKKGPLRPPNIDFPEILADQLPL
jgi:hypothetical protein